MLWLKFNLKPSPNKYYMYSYLFTWVYHTEVRLRLVTNFLLVAWKWKGKMEATVECCIRSGIPLKLRFGGNLPESVSQGLEGQPPVQHPHTQISRLESRSHSLFFLLPCGAAGGTWRDMEASSSLPARPSFLSLLSELLFPLMCLADYGGFWAQWTRLEHSNGGRKAKEREAATFKYDFIHHRGNKSTSIIQGCAEVWSGDHESSPVA